jgi:glycosyltransferase involved in cell wall biosynthesis
MRALPDMLKRLPNAQVLIVGGNEVSYGRRPNSAKTWREQMLNELGDRLDAGRVHFLGHVPYAQYLAVLQISSAHVYFTYPFVLSWSFLEAMAAGCHIVASGTPPIEEVVTDGENAELVDFFDRETLVDRVVAAVSSRNEGLRAAARHTVLSRYDLSSVCLPNYVGLLRRVIRKGVN